MKINTRQPKFVAPWVDVFIPSRSWRKSQRQGKKPKKQEYWRNSFLDGWVWWGELYKLDMEDYLNDK